MPRCEYHPVSLCPAAKNYRAFIYTKEQGWIYKRGSHKQAHDRIHSPYTLNYWQKWGKIQEFAKTGYKTMTVILYNNNSIHFPTNTM